MTSIIVLNIVFAGLVIGGIVGMLAHSVWTSHRHAAVQPKLARTQAQAQAKAQARRQPARRLTTVNG